MSKHQNRGIISFGEGRTAAASAQRRSHSRRSRWIAAGILAAAVGAVSSTPAFAAPLYWDLDGAIAGATETGTTAPGTWDEALTNWSTSADGTVATGAWVAGSDAVFSAGTDATGASAISVGGVQQAASIHFQEGTVTLSGGNINLQGAGTDAGILTVTANTTNVISAVLEGANGITVNRTAGTGSVTLSGVNAFTGGMTLNGRVNINTTGATGTGLITLNSGATATSTATLSATSSVTIDNDILINAGTTAVDISANGGFNLILNGQITGAGDWTRGGTGGTGTVILANSNNNFTGRITITAGTLAVSADNALGAPGNTGANTTGNVVVNDGTLAFQDNVNYTAAEQIIISGFHNPARTAIDSLSGDNVFAGNIRSNSANIMRIGAASGSSLTLTGGILDFGSAAARPYAKVGAGTLVIATDTTSGINDTFTVAGGVLRVGHANSTAGSITSPTANIIVGTGAKLEVDNSAQNNNDRFNDTAAVTVAGGDFVYLGNAAGSTETLALRGGYNLLTQQAGLTTGQTGFVTVTPSGGASAALTASTYFPAEGSLTVIRAPGLGSTAGPGIGQVFVSDLANSAYRGGDGSLGTNKSVFAGTFGDTDIGGTGTELVTYDPAVGMKLMTAADYASSIVSGQTIPHNVALTTPQTLTADTTVGAIKLLAGGSISQATGNLTLETGVIWGQADGVITTNNLNVPGGHATLILPGNMTVNGDLSANQTLYKSGKGVLTLNGTNDVGQISIAGGNVVVKTPGGLGDGDRGVSVASGGSLRIETPGTNTYGDAISLSGSPLTVIRGNETRAGTVEAAHRDDIGFGSLNNLVGDNTITGDIELNGPSRNLGDPGLVTIGVGTGSTLTLTGVVGGQTFAKVGRGTLVLAGDSPNTYGGGSGQLSRILAGTIVLEKSGALGVGTALFANGTFMLANSESTIAFRSADSLNYTQEEGISIAGYGADGKGLIDNFGGDNTFAGPITLGNTFGSSFHTPNLIGVSAGSLDLTGVITGADSRQVIKQGPGRLILSASNTNGGIIDINEGTLAFRGNSATTGQLRPASSRLTTIYAVPGSTLEFDNTGFARTNRLNEFVTVNLTGGGEFKLTGHATNSVNQDLPAILVGDATLTVVSNGAPLTKINQTLDGRSDGGPTLFVRSAGLGGAGSQISLTSEPSAIGGGGAPGSTDVSIIPFATGANSATSAPTDLVAYDAVNGFRTLTAGEYLTTTPAGDTNANHNLAASATLAGPVGINAAKLSATGQTLNLGGSTLTVKSGALLAAAAATPGASTISNGTLNFDFSEGIITTAAGHDLTVSAAIAGGRGLTKSGPGVLTLSNTNTYTGQTSLNGGVLVISSEANLGEVFNPLFFSGGTLRPTAAATGLSADKSITLQASARAGVGGFDIPTGGTFTVAGTIGGPGILVKRGEGTLVLENTGSFYSGGTQILDGVLSIANGAALGNTNRDDDGFAAAVTLNGGTLRATAPLTELGSRILWFGPEGGTFDVPAGVVLTHDTVDGGTPVRGPGGFTKTGAGTLDFLGNGLAQNGATTIMDGIVRLNVANALPSSPLNPYIFVKGGKLQLNNITLTERADIVLSGTGGLSGTGVAAYRRLQGLRIVDGADAFLEAPGVDDVLTIERAPTPVVGNLLVGNTIVNDGTGAVKPTIGIRGAGLVHIMDEPIAGFLGNWQVQGGRLRINDTDAALGHVSNTLGFSAAGGTVLTQASANRSYNYPVSVGGNAAFTHESISGEGFTHTFGPLSVTAPATITMDAPATSLTPVNSGNIGLVFGNTTLAADATFNVLAPETGGGTGSITLGNLSETGGSRGITKTGPGTLILAGAGPASAITGPLNVSAGLTSVTGNLSVQKAVGAGALNIAGSLTLAPASGNSVSELSDLTIAGATDAWTGKLDVKDNDVVLRATAATRDAVHDRTFNQLKQGIDANNPAGFWGGTAGITSSTAAANQSGFLTGVGMIINDYATANLGTGPVLTDIGGVAVDINDVIVKYTWAGDADLNGTIDGGDYFLIDNGFAQSLVDGGWLNGDFDYNGVIDGGDFFLIDNAFAQQGTTVLSSGAAGAAGAAVASAVPEPSVLGLAAVSALGLLARRRRHR